MFAMIRWLLFSQFAFNSVVVWFIRHEFALYLVCYWLTIG